jgi:hypothetical protein
MKEAARIPQAPLVMWFEDLGRADVALVGGKTASLGEMVRHLGKRASGFRPASPPPRQHESIFRGLGTRIRRSVGRVLIVF